MSRRTLNMTDELIAYVRTRGFREPAVLADLRAETAKLEAAGMQISPEQGALMTNLMRMMGARRTLEVGVFTGYSTLAVAFGLPPDGEIVACDVSEEWTAIARRYWKRAGVADRIALHLGPAAETLDALMAEGGAGTFDFAFIDADKAGYDAYYERSLQLLRAGGVVGIDNVLWGGSVADAAREDGDTLAIRALNDKIAEDARVDPSMIPIGDGLTLAVKR